jgi:hypothetical protein
MVDVLVHVLGDLRRIEEPRDVQLRWSLRVSREKEMHVIALG